MAGHLPDPLWARSPQECLGCGYALEGLAAPGRCPECGAPFDVQSLVLHGVPRSSRGTSPWRRAAWIATLAFGFLLVETWVHIGLFLSWWLVLAGVAAVGAAAFGLLATGPRERAGTERFILTSAGLARVATKAKQGEKLDSILVQFNDCDVVWLQRVGPFWRRLRIGIRNPAKPRSVRYIFDAGIRCPDDQAAAVYQALLAAAPRAAAAAHPPTNPGFLPGSPHPPTRP